MSDPMPLPTRDAGYEARGIMVAAYTRYFRSGACDEHCLRDNIRELSRIRPVLPVGGHGIDYGCANGRNLVARRGQAGSASKSGVLAVAAPAGAPMG